MSENSHDTGVITVMLERLNSQRLPRALALKVKVDNGERINEFDIAFLDEVFADANQIKPLLQRHPEYQSIVSNVIDLYWEITNKALQNEENN